MAARRGVAPGALDQEIVAPGLARDRRVDRVLERRVALRAAQRRAQIGGVVLAQAHVKRAGAGDAHAVAALAEIVGEGVMKPSLPPVSPTSK